jgi:succinyl-diaminopimelate desuccinylase
MLDTIELSKKLISYESVTPAKQDIFDFLINIFKEQGFTTKQLNFDGDGSYEVINLMATFGSPNTNAKHFNFLCHVDVVPPGNIEDWDTHPFEPTIKDGYLYGSGSEDMKGCTAASMVSVFKFIKDNPDFNGTISFIITGDEEADSINGVDKVVNWLQENNIRIDGSIATESSSEKVIGDQIKVGRKGAVDIQIEIIGKQGHAAYPQLAQNPVHCMSKIISFFDDQILDKGQNTLSLLLCNLLKLILITKPRMLYLKKLLQLLICDLMIIGTKKKLKIILMNIYQGYVMKIIVPII